VVLKAKCNYVLEVTVVHVSVDSKQSLKYHLYDLHEVLGEGNAHLAREEVLIVDLIFQPKSSGSRCTLKQRLSEEF